MTDTSSNERVIAQQRRIVGLVVLVVLVALAVGVVVLVGSAVGGLRDLPTSGDPSAVTSDDDVG